MTVIATHDALIAHHPDLPVCLHVTRKGNALRAWWLSQGAGRVLSVLVGLA